MCSNDKRGNRTNVPGPFSIPGGFVDVFEMAGPGETGGIGGGAIVSGLRRVVEDIEWRGLCGEGGTELRSGAM